MMSNRPHRGTVLDGIGKKITLLSLLQIAVVVAALLALMIHSADAGTPTMAILTLLAALACLNTAALSVVKKAAGRADADSADFKEKLRQVLRACSAIQIEDHDDTIIRQTAENLITLTNAYAAAAYTRGDGMLLRRSFGTEEDAFQSFPLDGGGGLINWVFHNGTVDRIVSPADDPRFDRRLDLFAEPAPASVLYIPLTVRHETIGVIALAGSRTDSFEQEKPGLLAFLGNQTGSAMERSRRYEAQKNYEIHFTNILVAAMDNLMLEKRGHAQRVAHYALAVADRLNMTDEERKRLYHAALLHDIGFLKIRLDEVFSKEDYKRHSQLGYDLLKPITACTELADIILSHHERYDGKGYPYGLKGRQIPIESRIIFIAEAFDAMVSRYSYKRIGRTSDGDRDHGRYDCSAALEELQRNAGTQFDPGLTEVFSRAINEGADECLDVFRPAEQRNPAF